LAAQIPSFCARPQQVAMAVRIAAAIAGNEHLVVEAGTGTGKTLAYLVPALLAGGKVLLSTASKALQDQLFQRDLPAVRSALKRPLRMALLKGRANYVCHYHLERALADGRFHSRDEIVQLQRIARFARISDSGDRMALSEVGEDAPVWGYAVSTRDNCLGSDCGYHGDCFVLKARKEALEADVVVINHHLFFADIWLKDEGAGELLPSANLVVFDEAHQLPVIAEGFFGERVSGGQLLDLVTDVRQEAAVHAADYLLLPEAAVILEKSVRDARLSLGELPGRLPAERLRPQSLDALLQMQTKLAALLAQLQTQAERDESLERCLERAGEHAQVLDRWLNGQNAGLVRWVEVTAYGFVLHATPLDVGAEFGPHLEGASCTWVFTSATLSVRGDFSHFLGQIGLPQAQTAVWDSPYDYPAHALLYAPEAMPDPNAPHYTTALIDAAWPLIEACAGGVFLLFTSLRAMKEAHGLLESRLAESGRTLLLQGSDSRTLLLDRFRQLGNAVLLGSQSFWEGVDVAGEALSLVVIDRLPFQPPDDPVLAARIDAMRKAGGNPFFEAQLPHAVISLKQGAGRLIRRESDRGVLMVADPRLVDKPYGKRIWMALPPMRRTRVEAEAVEFLHALAV